MVGAVDAVANTVYQATARCAHKMLSRDDDPL